MVFHLNFQEVSHDKMSYNGGVSGGLEDPQNSQSNNWPFSVRYTASPYRKSKYPPASGGQEGPALPPHLNIQGSASPGGLGHGSHPWNGSNHQQNTYHQQGHPFLPSSGHHNHQNNHNHYHHIPNSANINSNTNRYVFLIFINTKIHTPYLVFKMGMKSIVHVFCF